MIDESNVECDVVSTVSLSETCFDVESSRWSVEDIDWLVRISGLSDETKIICELLLCVCVDMVTDV